MRSLIPLLVLAACTPDAVEPPSYRPPSGVTRAAYAPNSHLDTFPDLFHSQPDASTETGLRVRLGDAARDQLNALLPPGFTIVQGLEELDGFGTTAAVSIAFTAPVDPASFASSLRFVRLTDGATVPVETTWTDQGNTALMEPLFPLTPSTPYAAIVTHDLVDAAGGPVWRSVPLDEAITGDLDNAPAVLAKTWAQALDVTGLTRDDVAAGVVFVTQSIGAQDEAVKQVLLDAHSTLTAMECAPDGDRTRCEAVLHATDVLGDDETIGADEAPVALGTYDLPATFWLPGDGKSGPYPTVIHGHGLGGDRYEAHNDADPLSGIGFAVAAIDAPKHGDHPGAPDGDLLPILEFFGISFEGMSMDVRKLRDNFRLGAWEKLQLAAALRAGFDADADGHVDFDGAKLAYSGHSLGGVMGPQFLAQDPELGTGYLSVPGGRVSAIVQKSGTFAPLVALMQPPGALPGDLDRFFPLLQTSIERADPLNWAPQILDGHRDVLVQEVMDDDIMPNTTTRALVRALGVELVGPNLQTVEGLVVNPNPMPISGNVNGRTAVLYQYDDMVDDGQLVQATHTHIFACDSNQVQMPRWFQTWLDDGLSEAIDPFDAP